MPTILAINPNTSASITDLVARHLVALAAPGISYRAVTGRFGAAYVSSEAAFAIAGHAALDAWAAHGEGCDAVYLACFGDPGLFALRELCPVPVVGMAEASMRIAAQHGHYAIVTGGRRWKPMLERLADGLGLRDRLAAVRPVAWTGAQIAANPDAAIDSLAAECRAARETDGAKAVILGGAGLAGIAARVSPLVGFPVIDSVEAGARAAEALVAGARLPYARMASGATTPSIGLPAALAERLGD